jgi:DNA-binding response OmpR family regulator
MRVHRNSTLNTLRVLIVEEDPSVLNACCSWLINEGCDVSTQRTPGNILQCVKRARAEVVLIDPLMQELSGDELSLLLTRCGHPGAPSVILHSRLSYQMLRVLLETKEARGIIHKGCTAQEFTSAFRALTRLAWAKPANSLHPVSPAASGTHRIGDVSGELVVLPRNGSRRGH